jgi:hypothetical protein
LATKQALTITELKKLADEHLGNIAINPKGSPIFRVARLLPDIRAGMCVWEAARRFDDAQISHVEFRAEELRLYGLPCTAWFYGDLLVKVCV